jgi:hypothetical protein
MKDSQSLSLKSFLSNKFFIAALVVVLFGGAYFLLKNKSYASQTDMVSLDSVIVSEDKSPLEKWYKLPHIVEWYKERVKPPAFDFSVDLSKKSYVELRLLRAEIFARNGYLFDEATLRGYFNQFKWYQPIFDVPEYKLILNKQEFEFVSKVLDLEQAKLEKKEISLGEYRLLDFDLASNSIQFKTLPPDLAKSLREKNFGIVPAGHEQLYYVYDANHYQYIPSFVTTDLYQQLLQKHLGRMLQSIEKEKLIVDMTALLQGLYTATKTMAENAPASNRKAAAWANTYSAVALGLITETKPAVLPEFKNEYDYEMNCTSMATGEKSEFLDNLLMNYSTFKPRGSYTQSDTLKRYFRSIKWLNTAPVFVDNYQGLTAAIYLACAMRDNSQLLKIYENFSKTVGLFAGDEDNLSLSHLIKALDGRNPDDFTSKSDFDELRSDLAKVDPDRIKSQAADPLTAQYMKRMNILFTAGRYTFDAEILSRMVHVLRNPVPLRPFPKALDVMAVLGNKTAESILLNDYKENAKWPQYGDTLKMMKEKLGGFNNWDFSIYNKTMENMLALQQPAQKGDPLFMQTRWWDKRKLSTSLCAWTQLKHNMILYIEEPNGAQAGEGGGPPPPQHIGYVEPNVAFWTKSIELLKYQEKVLSEAGMLTAKISEIDKDLIDMGTLFLNISNKELKHEPLTKAEFDEISWIGGRVESLTFRILGNWILPENEKNIALAADVYRFNNEVLQEGVGTADEIYVLVEINGLPCIARGSVFSYYEFVSPNRLTDEEWQVMLKQRPDRPIWLKELMINCKPLESKAEYSF